MNQSVDFLHSRKLGWHIRFLCIFYKFVFYSKFSIEWFWNFSFNSWKSSTSVHLLLFQHLTWDNCLVEVSEGLTKQSKFCKLTKDIECFSKYFWCPSCDGFFNRPDTFNRHLMTCKDHWHIYPGTYLHFEKRCLKSWKISISQFRNITNYSTT